MPSAEAQNSAPVVTNVVAMQIPGTGNVRVTFDLADADGDSVVPNLVCSSDNGVNFDLVPVSVTGDVNKKVAPGTGKEIIWNAAADYPGRFWPQVVANVYAADGIAAGGEMVLVAAGSFPMGSASGEADELPVHTVTLDAFYLDKFKVTNGEFKQFIDAGGYSTQGLWSPAGWSWRTANAVSQPLFWGDPSYRSGPSYPGFPVIGVSWYEADAYARFVGKRLPTEAEWEKGARGTDGRTYPWGEGISGARANYSNSGDPYEFSLDQALITPVGFYDGRVDPPSGFVTTDSPGPYGTYDQAGNVWEWVGDWYQATYYASSPASNPPGPVTGINKVYRGGSWLLGISSLRSAERDGNAPTTRVKSVGLRLAMDAP